MNDSAGSGSQSNRVAATPRYAFYADRPDTLTAEFLRSEAERIVARIEEAESSTSAEQWIALFDDWDALSSYASDEHSRINFRYCRNLTDREAEIAEEYQREQVEPILEEYAATMTRAMLASRHLKALGERNGRYWLRRLELGAIPVAPINAALRDRERELCSKYEKILNSAEFLLDGEVVGSGVIISSFGSADRSVRRNAYMAKYEWWRQHRDELASIFDELVRLRHQMGINLGYDNFIPVGYAQMKRTDYGPGEAAQFRQSVQSYVVPLLARLRKVRAAEHGSELLHVFDGSYSPSLSLPRGAAAPIDLQLERAQRVFDAISPELAGHFSRMRNEDLIDLESRPGKSRGGFCTTFDDEGRVAILCNSVGDGRDIEVLMHEMGHAFHNWESMSIMPVELRHPAADVAEIHSTSMEFLSLPYMHEFFDPENAEKFTRARWRGAMGSLCELASCDEFLHWIYEHPDATPEQRDAAWCEIDERYYPGSDYSGVEFSHPGEWYFVWHFFCAPFYTIDYALAEMAAMQLALIDARDHDRAIGIYRQLCRLGGTKSVLETFASAGLRSPFDPELMKDLVEHVRGGVGV